MNGDHLIRRALSDGYEQESVRLEELRTREFVGTITPEEVLELERIYRNRGIRPRPSSSTEGDAQ